MLILTYSLRQIPTEDTVLGIVTARVVVRKVEQDKGERLEDVLMKTSDMVSLWEFVVELGNLVVETVMQSLGRKLS